jgi:RNA polymerase-interacting CarD/CdnL/TRCF family regulator
MNGVQTMMSDDQFNHLLERLTPKEIQQNAFERHAQTALTSLIVLLLAGVVGFIFKISDSQNDQVIETRVLQFQVKDLAEEVRGASGISTERINRLEASLNTLQLHSRAHKSDIILLARHIEALCDCTVKLHDPEKF